ncbi:MAG: nitrilase-related carbon-nitrogen hydrolase [Ignavibacteria bacterium]
MKCGYLQFKPELCNADANIAKILEMTGSHKKEFDLLVMPELANSGYLFTSMDKAISASEEIPHGKFCQTLIKIAQDNNAYIVSGLSERAGDKLFNSSILVGPNGEVNTYRKTHLFHEEKLWFQPGDSGLNVFEISGGFGKVKVGMMICFDWIFPEAARTLALKGAQIIAHPSNLVLEYCQRAMFTRAIENHVFTITANRIGTEVNKKTHKELFFTGQSVIVDPKGNYLAEGSKDTEEIVIVEIDPNAALNKDITGMNNILKDRRTEFYS